MSARDDYSYLAKIEKFLVGAGVDKQYTAALDEIDRLRAEVNECARMYAEVAKVYDHITDGMISKPETDSVHVIAEADHQVMRRIDEALQEDREARP